MAKAKKKVKRAKKISPPSKPIAPDVVDGEPDLPLKALLVRRADGSPAVKPEPTKDEINAFLSNVEDEVPWPEEVRVRTIPQQAEDGKLIAKPPDDVTKRTESHPLAVGLRAAKAKIAKILEDVDNLDQLETKLQEEFNEDAAKFLRTYEPLLRRYEELGDPSDRPKVPLRILIAGKAAIELGGD